VLARADLTGARLVADLTSADLRDATLSELRGGAAMRNQSMGLIRAVLTSARLDGAKLTRADLARAKLEFASLTGADLTETSLVGAELAGADLTGARITGADFRNADVSGAKLRTLSGLEAAKNLDQLVNADRALRD
jgi:uncharacterized protein YjbI with pentapeptide repeats